ncbi:MAG: SDR family oxidoreductase [Actinobacteria bacterium]|nr:SDR family oxidoreductase [Actinomycetota bacterium]
MLALKFVKEGASLVICARDFRKLKDTLKELTQIAAPGQRITILQTDVSVEKDVRQLVAASIEALGRIDILVNNAGVYGPKGSIEKVDWQEWVKAIEINLFGTVLLCKEIIPHMKRNNYGKIINLSGGGATAPLPGISAYAASKAAVVRLTETLAEECRSFNIDINAVAPGALNTRLLDEVLSAGPAAVGQAFYEKALKQKETGGTPLEKGAELCSYLASSETDGITGKLISAVWDPWEKLASYKAQLQQSDIYTLRRIIPEGRDEKWGQK